MDTSKQTSMLLIFFHRKGPTFQPIREDLFKQTARVQSPVFFPAQKQCQTMGLHAKGVFSTITLLAKAVFSIQPMKLLHLIRPSMKIMLCCFLFSVAHNTRLCIASILSCFSCVFSQKITEIKDSELGDYNVEDGVMVCEVNTCSRKRKKKPTKRQLSKRVHHMPTGCGCFVPCSCKHIHKKFSCTEIILQNVKALT